MCRNPALRAAAKKEGVSHGSRPADNRRFQKLISDKYETIDRERGSAKTFLWFIEEVGELATALNGTDRANLQEEFADVFAWLCTLANINDIDLTAAVRTKYFAAEP
jgi:NTP pyrophosphatase (non-canonical NTP hydrolase)